MIGRRSICASALAIAAACGVLACGGGQHEAVVIKVGGQGVTNAAIAHWMGVMSPQHVLPIPPHYTACVNHERSIKRQASAADLKQTCLHQYDATRRQVLSFLISSRWLTGEAARQGVAVSKREVQQHLAERQSAYSSSAEFKETLKAIAHTVADLELEIETELASAKIRGKLAQRETPVSAAEVASYYREHVHDYEIPERRFFNIAEALSSERAARKLIAEVNANPRGAQAILSGRSLQESYPREPFSNYIGEKRTIYEAIFKARRDVITQPIHLINAYFLIYVTRIAPAHLLALTQVRASIEKKLTEAHRKETLAGFIASWRKRWIAQTDCSEGYVVQKCRQYTGAKTAEEPLTFN